MAIGRAVKAASRKQGGSRLYGLLLFLLVWSSAAPAKQVLAKPGENWCARLNGLSPGDTLWLSPGLYERPCHIHVSGAVAQPITLASKDPDRRAVLAYRGGSANVLDITDAHHLVIRDLDFVRTRRNVDAIRIRSGSDIRVENNRFTAIAGISVAAGNGNTARITIRGNRFRRLAATAIYIGCHSGECRGEDIRVEDNLIDGVMPAPGNVGYGVQYKLNSWGVIRNNRVFDTKGPGIMVYGSRDDGPDTKVTANLVEGSRTDGGIVIGGGPALVTNNIVLHNHIGGIVAQDYQERDLQARVRIVNNTVIDNYQVGIHLQHWRAGRGNVLVNNAIVAFPDTPAIDPPVPEGRVQGNHICVRPERCFRQPWHPPYDLRPLAVLREPHPENTLDEPRDDYFGIPRGATTAVGAIDGDNCGIKGCLIGQERYR